MSFLLAHLSDLHLTPPETLAGPLAFKQRLSRRAWRRKASEHSPEVLAALVADVHAHAPDHVVVTGDLTNFSTPEEKLAAAAWLEALAPPADLTVSPGNHDALVPAGADPWAAWRPWMEDAAGALPRLRVRGRIALFNLSSAVPTPPLFAQGRLGEAQLARLETALAAAGSEGLHRVLLVHHPVTPGVVSRRKALTDAPAFAQLLRRAGAELVLHGHAHRPSLALLPGPEGAIPVLGVSSASAPGGGHAAARWHAIRFDPGAAGVGTTVTVRGLLPAGGFGELGRYTLPPQRR